MNEFLGGLIAGRLLGKAFMWAVIGLLLIAYSGVGRACTLSADLARVPVAYNVDRLTLVVSNSAKLGCTTAVSLIEMPASALLSPLTAPAGCKAYSHEATLFWACAVGELPAGASATVAAQFEWAGGAVPVCLPVSVSAGGPNNTKERYSASRSVCRTAALK